METLKKVGAIVVAGLLLGGVAGYTVHYQHGVQADALKAQQADNDAKLADAAAAQAELQKQLEAGQADKVAVQAQLDEIQASMARLEDEKARDALVLADAQAELDKLHVEQAKTQATQKSDDRDVIDDLSLGASVALTTLDNNDLSFLMDGEIKFNDERYDVKEKIILSSLGVTTSLAGDEDFKDLPALTLNSEGAIQYRYIFDEALNYTEVSEDEPLIITMAGKEYRIIEVQAGQFTVLDGTEYALKEGASVDYNGKKITALTVADNDKAYIDVDGKAVVIDEGKSKTVNGVDVRVDNVVYSGKDTVISMVELTVSDSDAERVIENGDDYVDGDDLYKWVMSTTGDTLNYIGLDHNEIENDADELVLYPGDKMSFVELFDIGFAWNKDYKYNDYKIDLDTATAADIPSIRLKSLDGKHLIIGDEERTEAWYDGTNVYYKDDDDNWVTSNLTLQVENEDLVYDVSYNGTYVSIGQIQLDVSSGFTKFGAEENDAAASDLVVAGKQLGRRDNEVLLTDGTVIDGPRGDLDNDKLAFRMPNEVAEVLITISK